MVAMTWPDDPAIPVDWIFDELYEKAQPGVDQDPSLAWFDLFTTDNPNLRQDAVAERAGQMSEGERAARIYGQPIRLSNRVHPLFTDVTHWWCYSCNKPILRNDQSQCGTCGGEDITSYCHVDDVPGNPHYPVVFLLDPHPRKPHCLLWAQIDPNDDWQVVMEAEFDGGPDELAAFVQELESDRRWSTIRRLIDPNMGRSPASADRDLTWQDAFERAGLRCDLADDADVGRAQLNQFLKPDPKTRRPRFMVDISCTTTIHQLKRFLWDDHKRGTDKDQKQKPKAKHDDMPACLRYAMNTDPSFRGLRQMHRPHVRRTVGERSLVGY
jgi:hypothetical protein